MKKLSLLALLCVWCYVVVAQVTTIPAILQQGYTGEVTIIFNPNEGNEGMKSATQCYAHTGYNNWQGAPEWRSGLAKHKMTKNSDGNWELKLTPDMYSWYGTTTATTITRLCFVFNDGPSGSLDGRTKEGGDIFVPVVEAGLAVSLKADKQDMASQGEEITLVGTATEEAELVLKHNGAVVNTEVGTSIAYTTTLTEKGSNSFELIASKDGVSKTAKKTLYVCGTPVEEKCPYEDLGIYYDETDNKKCTLVTYAADKDGNTAKHVFLIGDMTNWQMSNNYQLKKDGPYFWITLDNLTPQKEYAFQYAVVRADGVVKRLCDLYSEKVLSPDDKYEPKQHDPTLKTYPSGADGSYVTVIQTDKPKFEWSDATKNFKRPNKNNLVIYELWVYDFTHNRGFAGVLNRLDYLEQLGVNAIEFMPLSEFDGNYNWGYSPCLYLAMDKAYGSQNEFKQLVDECHKRGIAVIVDMVFNHATGNNPMNKLYPYTSADKTQSELRLNPWFNINPPHGDTYYEDWNHDFAPAHNMFIRTMKYWLEEYKIDGYRLDLSHGLCGPTDDAVKNLKDYYSKAVEPYGAYMILEHWGNHASSDWSTLIKAGMQCWSNTNNAYMEGAMGYYSKASFTDANADGKVSYCESHDEERMQFKAMKYGSGDVKKEEVRVKRVPACVAMNVLLNGSHMLWMFEEVGYDHSINSDITHPDGNNDDYRCNKKPRYEPYLHNELRMEQYTKVAQAIQLRTKLMPEVFEGDPTTYSLGGTPVKSVQWGSNVFVVANFHPSEDKSVSLPSGTWYDYYANGAKAGSSVTLKAGELKIYTGKKVDLPKIDTTKVNIEQVLQDAANASYYKFYRDGNIYIQREGKIYDMMGRRVQ